MRFICKQIRNELKSISLYADEIERCKDIDVNVAQQLLSIAMNKLGQLDLLLKMQDTYMRKLETDSKEDNKYKEMAHIYYEDNITEYYNLKDRMAKMK